MALMAWGRHSNGRRKRTSPRFATAFNIFNATRFMLCACSSTQTSVQRTDVNSVPGRNSYFVKCLITVSTCSGVSVKGRYLAASNFPFDFFVRFGNLELADHCQKKLPIGFCRNLKRDTAQYREGLRV